MKIHTLNNGSTIIHLSDHKFTFSDGTIAEAQDIELVEYFTLQRVYKEKPSINGMKVNELCFILSDNQLDMLKELSSYADIVLLPLPMLTALRNTGRRDEFINCLAYNSTIETQRKPFAEKIVDINNWSY